MKTQRFASYPLFLVLFLVGALLQSGCSSDDSTTPPAAPPGPQVLLVAPGDLESGVNVSQNIQVTFDQDLDATQDLLNPVPLVTTVPEVVISSITRPTPNSILINHNPYDAGVEVTVGLDQRIRGSNGSEMGAPYTWSFFTDTIQVLFLGSLPVHESTDVDINTTVSLLFSAPMNLLSLATDMTVERVLPTPPGGSAPLGFTLAEGDGNWVILSFDEDLAAQSTTRIIMPTTLQAADGRTLAVEAFVTFTTGDNADTTPPQIVSLQPANGSTIATSTDFFRFTFSEPVNPDNFSPSKLGAQLALLLEHAPADVQWSENFTILTVPLPTPLPDGTPLQATFAQFEDLAGNVNTDGLDYAVTVTGAADYYPFIDGLDFTFETIRNGGGTGGPTGPEYRTSYQGMKRQDSDTFNRVEYNDSSFTDYDNWDILGRTSSAIMLQGFTDDQDGTPVTTTLTPPVDWLKLPLSAQTWSGTTTATNSGGSVTIQYDAELVGQENLPLVAPGVEGPSLRAWPSVSKRAEEPAVLWLDCWKWILNYQMLEEETVVSSGADTLWYAPSVGVVWDRSREENGDGDWEWTQGYLTAYYPPGTAPQQ